MPVIVHMATRDAWQSAQEARAYRAPSLESEGFIHFSTPVQVVRVANAIYAGRADLVLLVVDPQALTAELRYEAPVHEDSPELFPHLYGPLNLDAVKSVLPFPPGPDGTFILPAELTA
jgi:uncharacterized protein (DUF952 family)